MRCFCRLALMSFCLLLLGLSVARAEGIGPILEGLASGKYNDITKSVEDLAVSGDPGAARIIEALGDGRLLVRPSDKAVFVKTKSGEIVAAESGAAATGVAEASLKPVRINNRVRRAIETAVGLLTLTSPNRDARLSAADSVFKSRDEAALPALERALANEKDPEVRRAMQQAAAALRVSKAGTPEPELLEFVAVLRDRGDEDAKAVLSSMPSDQGPAVQAAVAAAIDAIDRHLEILSAAQNVIYGISLGSVLLLAAIGLAITFGVMGVINMAHGEMVMLGAYVTWLIQDYCRASLPELMTWSLLLAVPAAFLVSGAVGVVIERTIIRFLYGRPLETLLATFGLSLILQQLVRTAFGASNREVSTPEWMRGSTDLLAGLTATNNRIAIVIFCLLVFFCLLAVMRFTRFGLEMRAVTQNRRMAAAMGIRTTWVDALTFGLGSGIAGIAGVAISQIDNVSPNLGQGYIIDSFMVVVFGGVGNLWGTLTGAMTLGIVNKILEPYAGAVLGKILVLVAIILFIQKRPRGLFALKGRSVEA